MARPNAQAQARYRAAAAAVTAHAKQRTGLIAQALARIGSLIGAQIDAGLTGDPGRQAHDNSGGETVASVGYKNEYGVGVPERPWIRITNAKQRAKWVGLAGQVVQGAAKGNDRAERGLRRLGLVMVGDYKATIRAGVSPPNSAETIARKGSSKTLVDTGQMINAHRAELTLPGGFKELIA